MHSHRCVEDFEVPRLSECSSTLLFVQVGHGVVTVYIYGRSRKDSSRTFSWSWGFHHQVCGCFVANVSQCLRGKWGHEGDPYVLAGSPWRGYDRRLTDLEQWLRLPKGVTAMICWMSVAMAWLCCENVSRFENGDE